jgi:glucose-6-phosphate isomerase
MAEAEFNTEPIREVDAATIDALKRRTDESPRGRYRLCLHRDTDHPVQEMVIVCDRGTYFRPHRHPQIKGESLHMIEGELTVFFFDDSGKVIRTVELGAPGAGKTFYYRQDGNLWHLHVPRTDRVVFHETRTGPFNRDADNEYAPWSPEESDTTAVHAFLTKIGAA